MKGKIVRGSGFGGVLRYVLDEDKEASILGGNMLGRDAKSLAREFGPVRQLRPDCKRPVLHISLRMPSGVASRAPRANPLPVHEGKRRAGPSLRPSVRRSVGRGALTYILATPRPVLQPINGRDP